MLSRLKRTVVGMLPERAAMHLHALDHYLNGEPELRMLRKLVPAGSVAVDAGANIGSYAYFLRRIASVCAYEPNPELAARLQRCMPDVRVRNVALSDRSGQLTLRVPVGPNDRMNHELASVAEQFEGRTVDYSIDAVTLDSERLERVGFIKIDVEQHERAVLRGALDTIRPAGRSS